MKNVELWKETKILATKNGKFTFNSRYGIGSYLVSRLVIDKLDKYFKSSKSPNSILDVGCGYMPHFVFFKEKVKAENYVGVDWENSSHSSMNVDFYMNLNQELKINGEFDFILLMDVLEHLQDIDTIFKSLKKKLTTDGNLYITVPFYYWIHEAPHDYCRYTIYQLIHKLELSGFKVENYEIIGGFGTSLLDLISKNILNPLKLNNGFVRYLLLKSFNLFELLGLNKNKEIYPIEYVIKVGHL